MFEMIMWTKVQPVSICGAPLANHWPFGYVTAFPENVLPLHLYRSSIPMRYEPSHIWILPNQSGTMAKGGLLRWEAVFGKMQPSERCYEMAFEFRREARGLLDVMNVQAH